MSNLSRFPRLPVSGSDEVLIAEIRRRLAIIAKMGLVKGVKK